MKTFIHHIYNVTVYSENQTLKNGYIKLTNGKITEIGETHQYVRDQNDHVITLSPVYKVIPGAIDIHIHGASIPMQWTPHMKHYQQWQHALQKKEPPAFWPLL